MRNTGDDGARDGGDHGFVGENRKRVKAVAHEAIGEFVACGQIAPPHGIESRNGFPLRRVSGL